MVLVCRAPAFETGETAEAPPDRTEERIQMRAGIGGVSTSGAVIIRGGFTVITSPWANKWPVLNKTSHS